MSSEDDVRLPRTIRPLRYNIALDVDLDEASFQGHVTVQVEVLEATDVVECHALDLEIDDVSVAGSSVVAHRLDADAQRLIVELDAPLQPGPAELTVAFAGVLNDQLVGFYRSTYEDDDGKHTLAVTQFEAPHARRCFPCWDEPECKATFSVVLTVADDLLAISNSEEVSRRSVDGGKVEITFAETMPMSTYLVAFVVGRLEASRTVDVDGVPVRLIHRPGQGGARCDIALDIAAHSLRWFAEYYGIPYPGDKVDLVAVPDFAFGAMENLGCVTFREVLLILDADKLTQPELERAALVIAHELAHMWFGDLVTMDWWDGIWLNEAFATFMELACIDAYRPEWGVWRAFGLSKGQAFETDSLASTRSIHYEVRTPEDAEGMFDILTYEKGAAVLRMLEQFLGADTFRAGVREYLARHSYGNTHMTDLWDALESVTEHPVRAVMDSWILQGGHPLVTASATAEGVRLTQRRFGFAGGDPVEPRQWAVPIHLRAVVDGSTVEERVLLDQTELDVALGAAPSWLCVNAAADGFFRSSYDPKLSAAITADLGRLEPIERFGLIDDAWAGLLAGDGDVPAVASMLRAVDPTDLAIVWRRAAAVVTTLRLVGGERAATSVAAFATELAQPGLDDTSDMERRGVQLRLAGITGGWAPAIAECRAVLDADESANHPEMVAAAIDVVAANGDAADFDRFVELYRKGETPQEVQRYLAALTRFTDPELFDRLLQMCMDEVRTQNAPYTLGQAMSNPRHGAEAWTFVRDRWDTITEVFPTNSITRLLSGLRSLFDPEIAADVLAFFDDHDVPSGAKTLAQHLEMVRVNQALRSRIGASLVDLG